MAGWRSRALEHAQRKGFLRAGVWRFPQSEPGTVLEIKAGRLNSGGRGRDSLPPGHLQEKQGSKNSCSQPVPPPPCPPKSGPKLILYTVVVRQTGGWVLGGEPGPRGIQTGYLFQGLLNKFRMAYLWRAPRDQPLKLQTGKLRQG